MSWISDWRKRLAAWQGSLAARLELSHVAVATIGLLFAAMFSTVAYRHYLIQSQTQILMQRGNQISQVMQGFFSGSLSGRTAVELVSVLESTLNARVVVVGPQGQALLQSPPQGNLPSDPFPRPVLNQVLAHGQPWSGSLTGPSGSAVAAGIPVGVGNSVAGGVFLQSSVQDIQHTVRGLTLLLLLGEGFAIAVAAFLAWALGRRLARPLMRLTASARDLGDGSQESRVTPEGPQEIRELGQEFNRMADRIDQQMQRLVEESRLRDELVAHVAHDLKTPLTSIRGFLEAVRDGVATGDKQDRAIYVAWQETRRLERLVNRLLRMARLRENMEPTVRIALDGLWERVAERLAPVAEPQGIHFEHVGHHGLAIWGMEDAMMEALVNLVDNAIRYSPPGGVIRLITEVDPVHLRIAVADEGPGIPEDVLPHLFERFFTGDRSRTGGGNGLGLSIVQEIARQHGGEVVAENRSQGGAMFSLLLPIDRLTQAESLSS